MRTFRFRVNDAPPGGNYVDTTSAAEATDELLRQYYVDLAPSSGPSIVDFSESRERNEVVLPYHGDQRGLQDNLEEH